MEIRGRGGAVKIQVFGTPTYKALTTTMTEMKVSEVLGES